MWFYILIALAAGIVLLIRFLKPVYYTGSKPNLNSKTAIVTGGGGSIGLEIVKDLAKQNCFVIIADITNS
jgi:FlaA1/EpsC-like NDP-sugar epimerase